MPNNNININIIENKINENKIYKCKECENVLEKQYEKKCKLCKQCYKKKYKKIKLEQKEVIKKINCEICEKEIENKKKFCDDCFNKNKLEKNKSNFKKYYTVNREKEIERVKKYNYKKNLKKIICHICKSSYFEENEEKHLLNKKHLFLKQLKEVEELKLNN